MPIKKGTFASSIGELPTVTTNAVSNFNQNQATFNATVSANNLSTVVYFDYSTSSVFSSFTTVTATTVTGQNQSISSTVTGLANGTLYYVRCRAVNGVGTTTGNTVSFTTWSLKTYLNTTAGAYSVSVPSISGVAPTIYEMLTYGGGGAAAYGGGGGGGYRIASSHTSSVAGTQNITGTVGAGGTNPSNAIPAPAGGNSTVTFGGTTWTAGGGGGGGWLTDRAGSVGSGNNPAYIGGVGYYGYTYISGYNQYCCGGFDKNGNCLGFCPDYNSPIYTTDYSRYAGGGGAGTDQNGFDATYPDVGGQGGQGGGAYGLNGGNGGGGGGTAGAGANGSVVAGGVAVGRGGQGWWGSGTAGGVTFKYYGP